MTQTTTGSAGSCIEYVVTCRYGTDGELLTRTYRREADARAFVARHRQFKHHALGRPRGFRIERRAVEMPGAPDECEAVPSAV